MAVTVSNRHIATLFFALIIAQWGCSESPSVSDSTAEGGSSAGLTATTAGADAFAVIAGNGSSEFQSYDLVGIDSDGSLFEVFSESAFVIGLRTTSTHLIVSGVFEGLTAEDGSPIDCTLVAVPLEAVDAPARCLSQTMVGGMYGPDDQGWGLGIDVAPRGGGHGPRHIPARPLLRRSSGASPSDRFLPGRR